MKINKVTSLIIINLIIILPIVYLCFFNYPSADDYSYGVGLKNNSLIEILVDSYNDWTSRYFATTVLTLSPIGFGTIKYYGVYSIVFIILNILGLNYLFKSIQINSLKTRMLLAFSCLSVFTLLLTSLSENFYWLAGSVTYYLPSIMFVFLIGSLINLYNKPTITDFLISVISLLIIGGCVEVLVGYAAILITCFIAYDFYRNKRINYYFISCLVIILGVIIYIVLSPGNTAREDVMVSVVSMTDILVMTIKKVVVINIRYLSFAFIFFLFINSIISIKIVNFKISSLFTIFILMNIILFIGSFVPIYSLKAYFPPRVENILIFTSLFFVFILANSVYNLKLISNNKIYLITILVFGAYMILPKNEFQKQNNLTLVYDDIFSGKVAEYKEEQLKRDAYLRQCKQGCEIKRFDSPPRSLLFKEISTDKNHFFNLGVVEFYNLKSLEVK